MGEIDLQLAFNDQRMLDVWGPVGFVIALSQGCLVLGQVISMIGWYLGGLIDYPDSRVLQATFQSYVQMFSSPTFSECIESRPSCCFTACNHNKSMPAAHINIAPKSTAKLKGGEWIWDPVPLTRVRSMHAERAVDDPAAGREHSWNHLSTGQLWSGETGFIRGDMPWMILAFESDGSGFTLFYIIFIAEVAEGRHLKRTQASKEENSSSFGWTQGCVPKL